MHLAKDAEFAYNRDGKFCQGWGCEVFRRFSVLLFCLCLCFSLALAEDVSLAGYDDPNANHTWETNLVFQRMQERTGVTFAFRQYSDQGKWTKAKAEMRADDADLPEVLFKAELSEQETLTMYENGVLIDLKPYMAEHMPNLSRVLAEHPEWEKAITLPGGAIAALPTINELPSTNAIWINRAWLDALNLETPTTAEELEAVLIAFRDGDPNRNGRQDEVPMTFTGMWDLRWLSHAFGFISDDYYLTTGADGRVSEVLTSEENRAFLTWLNGLWEQKLLDGDGLTSLDTTRAITDSNATITFGVIFGPTPLSMIPSGAMDGFDLLMPLTCGGQQQYRLLFSGVSRGSFALTSACREPEKMLEWVDYFYGAEGSHMMQAGLPGVEYDLLDDGSWNWISAPEEVASVIMPTATLTDGTPAPCFIDREFQLQLDHPVTHRVVNLLAGLIELSRSPMPQLYLTADQRAQVQVLQPAIGTYADTMMNRFLTGEVPIDDENWAAFCAGLDERGLGEMVALWQSAADAAEGR